MGDKQEQKESKAAVKVAQEKRKLKHLHILQ